MVFLFAHNFTGGQRVLTASKKTRLVAETSGSQATLVFWIVLEIGFLVIWYNKRVKPWEGDSAFAVG